MRIAVLIISILVLTGMNAAGQVANSTNSFPSATNTNPAYLGSSTVVAGSQIGKLYVGGAAKLFQTGSSGKASPSLYLANTTAGTGRNYFINSDPTGLFRIVDSNANAVRFVINNSGNVGIGQTTPTAVLHLKAGTATAGTAPFKFTSGTNLTTAEAGAMEYNGSALFITVGSPAVARKEIAFADLSNITGTLGVARGGTGLTTVSTGDIFYGSATNIISRLPAGAAGRVLTMGSTGLPEWTVPSGGGTGITTLNTLTGTTQTFATGTSGTDFGISSSGTVHTFNIPTASASARGLLSAADWTVFNSKAPATGGSGYIQNGTAVQAGSNFNISGNGTIGTNLSVNGTSFEFGSASQPGQVVMYLKQQSNPSGNGWNFGYTSSASSDLYMYGHESAAFRVFTSTLERLTVGANGNVGIGNNNPAYKLDVTGDVQITSTSGASTGKLIVSRSGVGSITLEAVNSQAARLTGTLATQLSDYSGVYASTFRIAGGSGIVFNNSALQQIWSVDDAAVMNVGLNGWIKGKIKLYGNTSGNVTIQPADAAGTWTMTLPTSAGTNGQVLSTDGAGTTSWITSSGGGSQWTTTGSDIYYNLGKVGIGTATPSNLLEVSGNSNPAAIVKTTGATLAQMLVGDASNSFGLQYYPAGNCCWPTGTSILTTGSSAGNLVFHTLNPIQFYINNQERARFSAAGNFGIGVTNPSEKLDIGGNIRSSGYAQFYNAGFGVPNVKVGSDGVNPEAILVNGISISAPVIKIDNVVYAIDNGKAIIDITADHTYMYGSSNNGSGAALKYTVSAFNPASLNHFGSFITMQDNAAGSSANILPNYTKVQTVNGNAHAYYAEATIKPGGTGSAYAFYAQSGKSYFADPVSVGTTTIPSGYKLAVGGNIIAEKVRVKLQSAGWPDYVFEEKYPLPTLKETEQFIKANKHLPGVPSAAAVEKEGLDLGDGQAVLLKKIEELTLHMIEMDKKLEKLAAENEVLKKKLEK